MVCEPSLPPCLNEVVGDGGVVLVDGRGPGQVHTARGEGHDERLAGNTGHVCNQSIKQSITIRSLPGTLATSAINQLNNQPINHDQRLARNH